MDEVVEEQLDAVTKLENLRAPPGSRLHALAGDLEGRRRRNPSTELRTRLTGINAIHNHQVVDKLSVTLAALSDPTRRAILGRLKAGPASVTELSEPFGVSQQAISKHLAYLERANLVRTRREGRQQVRELNPTPIRDVADWTEEYRSYWEGAFSRLRELVGRQAAGQPRRKTRP